MSLQRRSEPCFMPCWFLEGGFWSTGVTWLIFFKDMGWGMLTGSGNRFSCPTRLTLQMSFYLGCVCMCAYTCVCWHIKRNLQHIIQVNGNLGHFKNFHSLEDTNFPPSFLFWNPHTNTVHMIFFFFKNQVIIPNSLFYPFLIFRSKSTHVTRFLNACAVAQG